MTRKIMAFVFSVALTAAAHGADLAAKVQPSAQPWAEPGVNWSGFYVGVVGGGGLQRTTFDDQSCVLSCSSQSLTGAGGTFGGVIGYNWQFSRTGVVGIEGDYDWANFHEQLPFPNGFNSSLSNKTDSFGTIRGRFGLDVGGTLIYATAGAAFVHRNAVGSFPNTGVVEYRTSGTATGIVGGAGIEYALPDNWSAKAEFLYIDTPSAVAHNIPSCGIGVCLFNVQSTTSIARAGLNYRFGAATP